MDGKNSIISLWYLGLSKYFKKNQGNPVYDPNISSGDIENLTGKNSISTKTSVFGIKSILSNLKNSLSSNNSIKGISGIFAFIIMIFYFILAFFIYWTIVSINSTSRTLQYICYSIYLWIMMLGFIIFIA